MAANYTERKVDHYEKDGLVIDTCPVTDSSEPFETAVQHPNYNDGKWIVVQTYNSKEEAETGHKKWVKKMTKKTLPNQLEDVSTAVIAEFCDIGGTGWRGKERTKKVK